MDPDAQLKAKLARLCRSRRTRTAAFTSKAPVKWQPTAVRDPRCERLTFFTQESAWNFIAECLEDTSVVVKHMKLDKPPGKDAYYFLAKGHGEAMIYVKLALEGNGVKCRSFHYSVYGETEQAK